MKTTIIFPGQGSQIAGMLAELDSGDPIVENAFRETMKALLIDPLEIDSQLKLRSTVNVQLSLLIIEVISARKLIQGGVRPDFVAGHSVGAFSAAVVAGVLTFSQALKLILLRSALMERAYPKGYGMMGVVGLSAFSVQSLLGQYNKEEEKLFISNINSEDQQVIAGKILDLQEFSLKLIPAGARKTQLLNISVPSHCRLMEDVALALKSKLEQLKLSEPKIPYVSNLKGRLLRSANAVREDLWRSVAATVQWYDGVTLLYELGARTFIEVEPSNVLSMLMRNFHSDVEVLSVSESNERDISWLWRQYSNGY